MKKIIGLSARSGEETLDEMLRAWSHTHGVVATNPKVIRVIGGEYTVQVDMPSDASEASSVKGAIRIPVDLERDNLLTDFGIATLQDRYFLPHEKSPQEAFARAAVAFADDPEHAKRLYDYSSKLWFMFSTPVLSNAPLRTSWGAGFDANFAPERYVTKKRGLPISCFLNFVPDSRAGLTDHYTENAWLSSMGGGVGGYWGAIRSNGIDTSGGSRSSGVMPFIKVVDSEVMAFAQGVTRRASYASYLDISHPEIVEFLDMRKPTGGDANRKCLNLHHGVNIPDAFMEIIEACMQDPHADDDWALVDPHSKKVTEVVSARSIWERILELRAQTGEPYLHFIDASNRALPESQRKAGLRVHQSNLCSEITLPTNEERTAVCCLSSVNLEQFDAWKGNPTFIEDIVRMLDNVIEYFVRNAPDEISKAKYSASMERSVGLGAMGFHSLLQQQGIPFESALATATNRQVFSHIHRQATAATVKLAQQRGSCPDAKGELRRNMHLIAVAPNASSSILCGGTSASIEPQRANAFTHKTQSGSWLVRNRYLEQALEKYGRNDEDTWQSIVLNKGSVRHLNVLSDHEKDVFKTAVELDQRWIIEHAKHRQDFICQSQSVNLFFAADADIAYLHAVHYLAWKGGLKSLYYLRSEAIKRADTVSVVIDKEQLVSGETCLSCEG
jgi:ribonucleoside-diphosphate reductase alpha chain